MEFHEKEGPRRGGRHGAQRRHSGQASRAQQQNVVKVGVSTTRYRVARRGRAGALAGAAHVGRRREPAWACSGARWTLSSTTTRPTRRTRRGSTPSCSTSTRSTCSIAPSDWTVPTAPIMPLVKQRGLLLDGQLPLPGEPQGGARHGLQQLPWNDASSWSEASWSSRTARASRQDGGVPRRRRGVRPEPGDPAYASLEKAGIQSVYNQNHLHDHRSLLVADPPHPRCQLDMVFASVVGTRTIRWLSARAVNEIGVGIGRQDVRRRHGRAAVHADHAVAREPVESS